MGAKAFTAFSKIANVVESIPEENDRIKFLYSVMRYGWFEEEPFLEFPYSAMFEGLREDIDNSRTSRNNNKGGRPRKNETLPETPEITGAKKTKNGGFNDCETGVSEIENGGYETAKTPVSKNENPNQANTSQNNIVQDRGSGANSCTKARPQDAAEVQMYADEFAASKGLPPIDAERFIAYHEQQGWKLSNGNSMKDWKATVRTWTLRQAKGGGNGRAGLQSEYATNGW